jgi:hypothetical protein
MIIPWVVVNFRRVGKNENDGRYQKARSNFENKERCRRMDRV